MDSTALAHYGIMGMKWGVRRTSEQLDRQKKYIDNSSDMVKEAKNINSSVSSIRSTSKMGNPENMGDQELKERVNRMNLEQQYSMLSSNQTSRGQNYVRNILEVGGSTLAIASSATAIALTIKQLRALKG